MVINMPCRGHCSAIHAMDGGTSSCQQSPAWTC